MSRPAGRRRLTGPTGASGRRQQVRGWLARRRVSAAALAEIGVERSRLTIRDAGREAVLAVTRAPLRTVLTSMGTVLAVGTAIATIGLSNSAAGAVSGTFDALRATIVTFSNTNRFQSPPDLTDRAEKPLDRLNGVVRAGLVWPLGNAGHLYQIGRTVPQPGQPQIGLPITAASAGGLATIGAVVSAGRLYDPGMDHRGDQVALLGATAARQLGITGVGESPVIFIGAEPFTVVGIVARAPLDPGALLGVIIPPGAAEAVAGSVGVDLFRQIMVRTVPGAAQLIGRQGPLAIDPLDPHRVSASVPTDPGKLRQSVNASLTSLLLAIALVALGVGVIAIANTTLLSVIQRRAEIGLRRSVGAAPRHIAVMVVFEAVLTGALGGLMGTSVGVLVISVVCAGHGWAPVLDPKLLLAAPAAGAVAGLLAGLYPAWRASRVSPISALQR
jgi:putative ABC transport system permease protein